MLIGFISRMMDEMVRYPAFLMSENAGGFPLLKERRPRHLNPVCPSGFMDGIHYKARED